MRAKRANTFRATLQALHSNHLIAHTQQAVSQRKYGETVLSGLPHDPIPTALCLANLHI